MLEAPLLARLDARDRALFTRFAMDAKSASRSRGVWLCITHLGGVTGSIVGALLASLLPQGSLALSWRALLALGLSHLVVQVVKRHAVRERPTSRLSFVSCIAAPDCFSFPSGHACAAMSVAFTLALGLPTLAPLLIGAGLCVGASRVVLGVHYPGDVLVGQLIAIVTALLIMAM